MTSLFPIGDRKKCFVIRIAPPEAASFVYNFGNHLQRAENPVVTNEEYKNRIDAVIRYMEENAGQKLSLEHLAHAANFSKYHFSRIFAAVTGETPMAFLNRKRLEKSVRLLAETNMTVLAIANECGFESLSAYHALFKKRYGTTPTGVRKHQGKHSNFSEAASKKQEETTSGKAYNQHRKHSLLERAWNQMIKIKELPALNVAYVRHVGSYLDTGSAWDKLGRWAAERGLTPQNQQFIGISLDDGGRVDEYSCRYDACITLSAGFMAEDETEVRFKPLPGGMFAVYPFYDTIDQFVLAYQNVFGLWLPNSGYEADDRPCLEFCLNDPAQDAEGKCRVDLYVPIKKSS